MAARCFPWIYDLVLAPCERLGLRRWRAQLLAAVDGEVLEIGAGTGANLPYYRCARRLVLTDPDPAMLARARQRGLRVNCPTAWAAADAQVLPFAAAAFDTVVATLVFCTIPHPEAAFAEVRRVLRPGGTLRLLEHVRAPRCWAARVQDRVTPLWRWLAHGCHLNRDTLAAARACGFRVTAVRQGLDGWLIAAELAPDGPVPE